MLEAPSYPGAVGPERSRDFDSRGFRLRLHEWGDPEGEPVVLCHGMWDHARAFDLLAPLLAERYRVVALDARGHGESDWADSYTYACGARDIARLLQSFGRPVRLLGHSWGGGQATSAAAVVPEHVHKLVNIEGFGPPKSGFMPPGREQYEPDSPELFCDYLDACRKLPREPSFRTYPTLDDLVERRRSSNPRLSTEWLRYFAWHAAHRHGDGFRWKADPMAGMGAGPFRPDWIAPGWQSVRAPMLAINGKEPDRWGLDDPELITERLAYIENVERVEMADAGHFPQIERPAETARIVLDFLEG